MSYCGFSFVRYNRGEKYTARHNCSACTETLHFSGRFGLYLNRTRASLREFIELSHPAYGFRRARGRTTTYCRRSGVKVFIRKIPRTSTPYLLKRFVESAMSRRWYSPFGIKGTIKSCVILRIKDPSTGEIDYYGLLDIHPVKAAQAVIQKLNMKRFEGHLVEVRKWHV